MAMQHGPVEDVFLIKNRRFSWIFHCHVGLPGKHLKHKRTKTSIEMVLPVCGSGWLATSDCNSTSGWWDSGVRRAKYLPKTSKNHPKPIWHSNFLRSFEMKWSGWLGTVGNHLHWCYQAAALIFSLSSSLAVSASSRSFLARKKAMIGTKDPQKKPCNNSQPMSVAVIYPPGN